MTRTINEKSADTGKLENLLREVAVGATVSYNDMSKSLGRDVRIFCKGNLSSARRILLNQDGVVFDAIRNVGYKKLNGPETVQIATSGRQKISRAARKVIKQLLTVDYEQLDTTNKRTHLALSSQMGAVSMFAKTATTKKIEAKVEGSQLAIGETLRMFTNGEA